MATFKHNMPACPTCSCTGGGTPCGAATACVSFLPACASAISGASISVTFTPDDGSTTHTSTGSSTTQCVTIGTIPGTLSWTYSSANYLASSGSARVTTCSPPTTTVTVYPNTYTLTGTGCNIGSDGTAITLTASGGISGSCSATGSGGTVSCTIAATAPVTSPVTIAIGASRYRTISGTTWNACGASVSIGADVGYSCCSPLSTCPPISDSRILSTPLGDFAYTQSAGGSSSTFTAAVSVTAAPLAGGPGTQDCAHPATASVLFTFAIDCAATTVTVTYTSCAGTFVPCNSDLLAEQDSTGFTGSASVGTACWTLTPACAPGTVGTSSGPIHPNRYFNGSCSVREA